MVQRIYRRKTVEQLTGLSRSTLYLLIKSGKFPRPVKLSGRAVGWREADIAEWQNGRVETGEAA